MKILYIIKTLTLIDLLKGLKVTLKNFFKPKITVQYPEVKTPISKGLKSNPEKLLQTKNHSSVPRS